jgi:MFS family permease
MKLISWFQEANSIYGAFFLSIIMFVYLAQGLRGYSDQTMMYLLKDMGFGPDTSQNVRVFSKQPWNIKWLYGLISDNIPILRLHCKPYLLLASLLGVVGFVSLSFESLSPSLVSLSAFLFLVQLSGAVADVLIDAMVVRFSRGTEDGSAGLQSLCWAALSVGGFLANIAGGFLIINIANKRVLFGIMSFIPVVMLLLTIFMKEPKSSFKPTPKVIGSQAIKLLRAFFAPPFTVLKTFAWIFMSNALCFNNSDAIVYFRVSCS